MRRLLFLAIILCAALPVGQEPGWQGATEAAAHGTERVEFREAPPSCAQSIKELHLEGQPVSCEEPRPPTYDPPEMHGPYRLIEPTYVGPLTYRDDPAPNFPVGVVSEDREVLQRSSLYRSPAWLPEGYALEALATGDTGSEDVLSALHTGTGQPVSIIWIRRYTWPLNVILPGPDSVLEFEALTIGDSPAILWYPKSGSSAASYLTTALSYVEGDVEVTVMGQQLGPEIAKAVAVSMACGAGCVSAELRDQQESLAGTQSMSAAASPADAHPQTALVLLSSEARILEGLGTPEFVMVSYHGPPENSYWHGFIDGPPYNYNEAALDLTDPDGTSEYTNVYYLAWLDAPGASITARTENHYTYHPIYNPTGSHCTGRDVVLSDADDPDHVYGRLTYVHLDDVSQPPPGDEWTSGSMWTVRYLGQTAETQEAGCGFTGPHLHQGQTLSSSDITYNAALPNLGAVIDPNSDYENNWMFKVTIQDSDDDGIPDGSDNCPYAYNPHQENTDSALILNGADIANVFRANPDKDAEGDACDLDDDNDGPDANDGLYTDVEEAAGCGSGATFHLLKDSDGDRAIDGYECKMGTDPNSPSQRPYCGTSTDSDGDGISNCIEEMGYGTLPNSTDTDGDSSGNDGCRDDKQIVDVNGDGVANILDVQAVARIALAPGPFDPVSKREADINKDGVNNILDVQIAANNSTLVEPHAPC